MKIFLFTLLLLQSSLVFANQKTLAGLFLIPQAGVGYDKEKGAGGRYGLSVQIGPADHVDAIYGYGLLAGIIDAPKPRIELGGSFVMMYMGSILLQGATRWTLEKEFAGAHVTAGFGMLFFLGYLRAGYDSVDKIGSVEVGGIFPLPAFLWFR